MKTPIHDFLAGYASSGTVRLHMPGGKGIVYPHDITEIYGADELYDSRGIIRESERCAAELFGAAETCYSCGGATLAIQAMLAAACEVTGKHRIAAGRYSHKSLISAAVLLGLDITWIYPEEFLGCRVSEEAVDAGIDGDTAAVFVNSIDYLGGEADIAALSEVCRRRGVLLLADNAHGAYKVFTGDHPLALGADMTADSAHKTLPAMTGTAYLHLADSSYYAAAKSAMSLFGSSSPSYLMLESLDLCNRFISDERTAASAAIERVRALKAELAAAGVPMRGSDGMRVTVDAPAMGFGGDELAGYLRTHGAECEMSGERYVVLLFSVVQPEADIARISEILRGCPRREQLPADPVPLIKPEKRMTPREAYFARRKKVPVSGAVGEVCAGISSPCPPCVPIVMPGEVISEQAAELMMRYGVSHIDVVR